MTRTAFRRRVRRYHNEIREDHAYPFFILRQADHTLLGGITLSNISRGMTQTATLGYWMGERYANQGTHDPCGSGHRAFRLRDASPASA